MYAWSPYAGGVLVVALAAATWSSRPARAAGSRLSAYDRQVDPVLAEMTLAEKIGQMTQAEQHQLADVKDIETCFLGSLLSGGDSDPKTNSLQDWTEMYERYQARALNTRLRIPILYGVDAVHGHNNVEGAVVFPHNIGLGATRDPALVEEIARVTAREVRATGIQWTFAPCVAVVRDIRWGRSYEGYSEDPALVAELGAAAVRGLQGDLSDPTRVLACAKHYLADGGTTYGSGPVPNADAPGQRHPLDQGDARLSEAELRRLHLPGYVRAVEAGVGSIMPSYSGWNGQKMSGHKYLLTDVLKNELGFEGFLISDYNAIDALSPDYRTAIKLSVEAGMDMFMVPGRYKELIGHLTDLVEKGEVPMSRIDDAVRRILRVKFAMGLFDPQRSHLADRALQQEFGSAEHRALARRAVAQSLVLMKNDRRTLPLSRTAARIHVAGGNADDVGNQCGGWTITWQGGSGPIMPGGTSVLAALRAAAGPRTQVTYSRDGSGAAGADVAVLVVGEKPYAEFKGDRAEVALDAADLAAYAALRRAKVPVALVVISGRPLVLGDAAGAEALVAAWLPGSEGAGVADVLFGDAKPKGKLPFTWPRTAEQVPIHAGDAGHDPLFAYGHGLSY